MDIDNIKDAISHEVKQLDLDHMDDGQLVEVITQKGTFWITRLQATDFHGSGDYVARIAIWSADYIAGNPLDMRCTRKLETGKMFEIFNGPEKIEVLIEHILLPI